MPSVRCVARSLALLAALAGAACGTPPDKELQQAQNAIDAARTAGAEQFARDALTAAQDALKRANDAVAQRDYRLALNLALDARERAQDATKEAADGMRAARASAERALAAAAAALSDARARLKAAETRRVPAKTLAAARHAIDNGNGALQEARTTFGRGDYLAARDAATRTAANLRDTARNLASAAPAPPRRHR
jgi:hypothetical protein